MQIQLTERSLYPNSHLKGVVRIFVPNDPTNYGFWFPEELLPHILSKEDIDKLYKTEDTLVIEVTEEQVDLIREKGNNPYHKGANMKKNGKSGFTLIEIMIVVIILGILLGFVGCGVMVFKGCRKVQNDGIKNIAADVWNGTNSPSQSQADSQ